MGLQSNACGLQPRGFSVLPSEVPCFLGDGVCNFCLYIYNHLSSQTALFWVIFLSSTMLLFRTSVVYRWYFLAYNVVTLVVNYGFRTSFDVLETNLELKRLTRERKRA